MGKVILEKILLKNWHAFQDNIFDISDLSTLITGMNASGKTTLLDAISMILDGANANDFNVAVKDEGERRTISGALHYVVSGVPRRTGKVSGLIIAQFYDQNYNVRFLNGLFLRSRSFGPDSGVEQKYFSIMNMSMDDPGFTSEYEKMPKRVDYITKKVAFEEFFKQRKMQHIRTDVYKGLVNSVLRAKLDCSLADFVKRNILPEDDKIASIEAIKNNYRLLDSREKMYEELSEEISLLKNICTLKNEMDTSEKRYAILSVCKEKTIKSKISDIEKKKEDLEKKIKKQTEEKHNLENELSEIAIKTGVHKSSSEVKEKKNELILTNRELITLKTELNKAEDLLNALSKLSGLIHNGTLKSYDMESVSDTVIYSVIEEAEEFIKSEEETIEDLKEEERQLKKEYQERSYGLSSTPKFSWKEKESYSTGFSGKIQSSKTLSELINKEVGKTVSYPFYELLSGIKDTSWQRAIETLIGNRRLHVVVEPEYESIAMKVQKKNVFHTDTDIILTSNSIIKETNPLTNSVAEQIITETKLAKQIIDFYYGKYILCNTIKEYEENDYALMKDGMVKNKMSSHKGKSGTSETLLIGKKAREDSAAEEKLKLKRIENELNEVKKSLYEKTAKLKSIRDTIAVIKARLPINTDIVDEYKRTLAKSQRLTKEIQEIETTEKDTVAESLQNQMKEVRKKIRDCEERLNNLISEKAKLSGLLDRANELLAEVRKQMLSIPLISELEETEIMEEYKSLEDTTVDGIAKLQNTLLLKGKNLANKIKLNQNDYNSKYHKDFKVGINETTLKEYDTRLNYLEEKAFEEITEEIRRLKKSLTDGKAGVFKGIAESFTFAENEIEKINSILKRYEISGNRFRIMLEPVIRRRDIYEAIRSFAKDEEPDEKVIERLDECFDKMINSKDDKTFNDLADYRNYLNCDVMISNAETKVWKSFSAEKGNFSGGQKETPYYMCLAATLSCKAYTNGGFRLIVLDEAFKNMDLVNKTKALSMFQNLNLQILLFTSNSDLVNCIDNIYVITKHDDRIVAAFGKNGEALKVIDKRVKS